VWKPVELEEAMITETEIRAGLNDLVTLAAMIERVGDGICSEELYVSGTLSRRQYAKAIRCFKLWGFVKKSNGRLQWTGPARWLQGKQHPRDCPSRNWSGAIQVLSCLQG
jgi:hypothetical protein